MKKFINKFLGLAVGATLIFGCQDELDLAPHSEIGDNAFYNTAEEVGGAVVAIYDGMQLVPLREFAITEMRSDNARSDSREGNWGEFEQFDVQSTNTVVASYWADNYNVIFRANRVLEKLSVVTDQATKNQYEGEAKFARALAHFNLVRAYGEVPLIDKVVIQTDEAYFAKNSATEVLALVASDLTTAASLLPSRGNMAEGRATKGAAEALLAKVKLTQGDYAGASSILNSLVNDSDYGLVSNYDDVFYKEENEEVMFAIRYTDDDTNEGQDFSFEMTQAGVASGLNIYTDDIFSVLTDGDSRKATLINAEKNDGTTAKYLTQSANARLCGNDWIVIRYADVLLMHAEAIMAGASSTSDASAIASFNKVRTRAGLDAISGSLTKEQLMDERRIELAFENHRLYDLVRFGEAENVLGAYAASTGVTFTATDLVLPIPQIEINVSNGALTQNAGY